MKYNFLKCTKGEERDIWAQLMKKGLAAFRKCLILLPIRRILKISYLQYYANVAEAIPSQQLLLFFENELYHFIRVQFSIDIKFNREIGKRNLRHAFQGRMDAVSNSLVIEYKRQTKLAAQAYQESAIDQISDYLQQLYSQGKPNNGVLTDGHRVCFSYWTNGQLSHSGFTTIGPASVDKIIWFLIGSEEKLFSSNNILEDFTLKNKKNPSYLLSQALFTAIRDNATLLKMYSRGIEKVRNARINTKVLGFQYLFPLNHCIARFYVVGTIADL